MPRMTIPTLLVLELLAGGDELYGLEIGQRAGLASGTVHPILARLEAEDWVRSRWEDVDAREAGRPARRYYALTEEGRREAETRLARARRPLGRARLLTGPA